MMDTIKKIFISKFDPLWIGLAAVFFGFFRLGHHSLWNDESISAIFSRHDLRWIWEVVPKSDLHPPLYYTLLHFWGNLFGQSETALRSLSAAAFVATAILLYYLAKDIFRNRQAALLTGVLFITNPFAIFYAQEMRSYSLLILLTVLSSWLFFRLIEEGRTGRWIAYALAAFALVYMNLLGWIVPFAHFVIAAIWQRKLFRRLAVIDIILWLLYIPYIRIIFGIAGGNFSYVYAEQFNIATKAIVAVAGFIGGRVNVLNGKWHQYYGILFVSLLVYFLLFAYLALRQRKQINKFIGWSFIITFLTMLILAEWKFPAADPKYFFMAFPFFLLLAVNSLLTMPGRWRWAGVGAIIILNGIFFYHYHFDKRYEKENWRSVVAMVEADYSKESGKTAISISPVSEAHTTWTYYSHGIIPSDGGTKYGNSTSSVYRALEEELGTGKDIVYLSRFIYSLYDPQDNIRAYLESHGYQKTKEIKDTKVEYWRYDLMSRKEKVESPASSAGRQK